MDCLEFRRLLGSDPRVTDPEARAHMESCARCADAYARAQAFEARLSHAMSIAVPEGLADRILFAQLTGERQRRRKGFRYGWIALAAAASLAVVVGVVHRERVLERPLPELVVEHIDGAERGALQDRTPIPSAAVERAFADRGVRLQSVPAGIAYVHECPIGSYSSVHMVMPVDDKPVSVVYVVRHRVPAERDFQRGKMKGREVPIADGTLVLVADNTSSFDALSHSWHDAIEGSAEIAAGSR